MLDLDSRRQCPGRSPRAPLWSVQPMCSHLDPGERVGLLSAATPLWRVCANSLQVLSATP